MPTIEITQQQADALAAGRNITVTTPKKNVRWNASFIPDASASWLIPGQPRWHSDDSDAVLAPKDEPTRAAQLFFEEILSDAAKGGLIAVCPRDAYRIDGQPFVLHTASTRYFRCGPDCVRAGVK